MKHCDSLEWTTSSAWHHPNNHLVVDVARQVILARRTVKRTGATIDTTPQTRQTVEQASGVRRAGTSPKADTIVDAIRVEE